MVSLPFVARAEVSGEIAAALDAACAGRGGLLVVTGEPGIGKSRLLQESAAGADGFTVVRSWCPPAAGAALRVWSQVTRALAAGSAAAARLVQDSPYLAGLAGRGPAHQGDPEGARSQLAFDLAGLLSAVAAQQPLLLLIDDLHDADASSLHLLAEVAPALPGTAAVVIAAARASDHAWPGRLAARSAILRSGTVIPLQPLGAGDVQALVGAAIASAPAGTAHAIYDRSGGNPFLATELIRLLAGRGPDLSLAGGAVSDTVRAITVAQLAGLPDPAFRLIRSAAVLGTRFRRDMLAGLAGVPLDGLQDLLAGARPAGLLGDGESGTEHFRHALIRDAVYAAIPAGTREELHARAGAVLAALADRGRDVTAAEVAFHLARAGPAAAGPAADYARRAGDAALAALAFEDAAHWYEQADASLGEAGAPAAGRSEAALALGAARLAAADSGGARAAFLRAAELARQADRPDLVARAALGFGGGPAGFEVSMLDGEQIALLEEARTGLPADQAALRALVTARLSVAASLVEPEPRRLQLAAEAVQLARSAGDQAALASALAARCDAQAGPGDCAARLADAAEIIALAGALRDPVLELLGRRLRLVALLETGDIAAWDTEARAYRVTAGALGHPLYLWYIPLWRGMRALLEGRLADCRDALAAAASLGQRAGSRNAELLVATQAWCLAAETDDREEVARLLAVLESADLGATWVQVSRALALAQLGRLAEARSQLDAAAPLLAAMPVDSEWLPSLTQVAETIALIGPHPAARWVHDALSPYAGLLAVEGICAAVRGPVSRHLALLAAALGDQPAAAAHRTAAAAAARALGAARLTSRIAAEAELVSSVLADAGMAGAEPTEPGLAGTGLAGTGPGGPADAEPTGPPGAGTPAGTARPAAGTFRRDGEVWLLRYEGREVRLRDSKGLRDLAVLLARPGAAVAALDLAASAAAGGRPGARAGAPAGLHAPADAGEVLDSHARQAYRQRLTELEEEADEADAFADAGRSARITAERDALVAALAQAYGLGGRPRRSGSPAERARTTVTARIRDAIRRIGDSHPQLGRHLSRSVQTGTFCSYEPEQPVRWTL